MLLIGQLTADPLQQQQLTLPDGSTIFLQLYYRSMQYGWFLNEFTYKTFTLNGLRITNGVNLLNQWRNILPLGLACITADGREPTQIEDFASGTAKLYILSAAEVAQYTTFLSSGSLL